MRDASQLYVRSHMKLDDLGSDGAVSPAYRPARLRKTEAKMADRAKPFGSQGMDRASGPASIVIGAVFRSVSSCSLLFDLVSHTHL